MVEDATGVLGPEGRVAVRRRPPQVARLHLGHVLVERRLRLGVLLQRLLELVQVLEQVRVRQVAPADVLEHRREPGQDGRGEEAGRVRLEEVI